MAAAVLTIGAGTAITTTPMRLGGAVSGSVHIPSVWDAADIGFKASDTEDGTYEFLRDQAGNPYRVRGVTVSSWQEIPIEVFLSQPGFIKPVSINTASEADVNQASARTLLIAVH